jgi:UDP-N-acetylglucosamine--dolichyl-phosphate N-acetylglucosaminephosphotransferase
LNVGRVAKVIFPLAFGLPIVFLVNPDTLNFIFWQFDLGGHFPVDGWMTFTYRFWFKLILIPVYIMVTANLINMHSGFNGLALGTTTLVATTLLVKGIFMGYSEEMLALATVVGCVTALTYFNKIPAQLFEGNVGALMNGSLVGVLIVVTSSYTAGFVMLIPHTINFLMYMYWRLQRIRHPERPWYGELKFGSLRPDGTLEVPNQLTLKWFPAYRWRKTEAQCVKYMWALTAVFCAIGFGVPG